MHRKLSISLLIISTILLIFFSVSFFFGPARRFIINYKNNITGTYNTITLYSATGNVIAKYSGKNTYFKATNNFIEIHIDNKKYIFSNIGVIIEEN